MDYNDLIARIQSFIYAFRRGQTEKILAGSVLLLFTAGLFLNQELKFTWLARVSWFLSAILMPWLILRLWKRAVVPPPPPAGPIPSAVKGLLPFTAADGNLFARLGRRSELQSLMAFAQDDQIAISIVRGESGAGKTSVLQAGVEYMLKQNCIYWEAVPVEPGDALLHAIRARFPNINSLDLLPEACLERCVLILDQFEQLQASNPNHMPIFELVERVQRAPAPHKLSLVVAFRREYLPDWADFEQAHDFRAEQLAISLLAPRTARDAFVTLTSEAGFTLDEALVGNFISSVVRQSGVSPVDIAIGVLSLANFAQQSGNTHIGVTEYELAGGSEGLLLAFVQQKLEEIPENIRAPLLKGLVLALIDLSNNQRIAEGETAAAIAAKAEAPESTLTTWLERFAHPRVRLLERIGNSNSKRYRFPHERLVPIFRRLTGETLAALDQLRLAFQTEYQRWRETRDQRHLLRGKDLRNILRNRGSFVQGENFAGKTEYLTACLRRRAIVRLALGVTIISTVLLAYGMDRVWENSIQHQKLMSWGLPPTLFEVQHEIDSLELANHAVNDLSWLRSTRLHTVSLRFNGTSLAGLEQLEGLTNLALDLGGSQVTSLAALQQLKELTTITLDLSGSQVTSLAGLEQLKGLTNLTLNLSPSQVTSLAGLERLKGLTNLTLDLYGSHVTSLAGLEQMKGLTNLTLNLLGSQVASLAALEQLKGLTNLTLNLGGSQVTSLAALQQLKELTNLTLVLPGSQVTSLSALQQLKGLTNLTLDFYGSQVTRLADLDQLTGLTNLTLDLIGSQVTSLADLQELTALKGLTNLTLDLGGSQVTSLAGLEQMKGLTTITLNLSYSQVTSLAGLEQLKGLTNLTLNLSGSQVTSLAGLEQLKGLTNLTLDLGASQVTSLAGLEQLKGLTNLTLDLYGSHVTRLAGLEQLKEIKSAELEISTAQIPSLAKLSLPMDRTKLTLFLDANDSTHLPVGYSSVTVTDSLRPLPAGPVSAIRVPTPKPIPPH